LCSLYIDTLGYTATPNYNNFTHFVDPQTSHAEDKIAYLFSPLIFQLVGLAAIFKQTPLAKFSERQYLLFLFAASLLGTTISASNAHSAVVAARMSGFPTKSNSIICLPVWSIICAKS
jgi:hypothetical protein